MGQGGSKNGVRRGAVSPARRVRGPGRSGRRRDARVGAPHPVSAAAGRLRRGARRLRHQRAGDRPGQVTAKAASLCHGDLGNVELLARAARLLDDDGLAEAHEARLAEIADSIERIGWACGVPLGVETPGLFNGIAGIGYGWLRAAAPEQAPSVMTLEPPNPE